MPAAPFHNKVCCSSSAHVSAFITVLGMGKEEVVAATGGLFITAVQS